MQLTVSKLRHYGTAIETLCTVYRNDRKLVPMSWIFVRQLQRQLNVVLPSSVMGPLKSELKLLALTYCL
jgi:hypothetical protein